MGKNRQQAGLVNVINYDVNNNLSLSSSPSSSIQTSGSVIATSITGSFTGSVFGFGNTTTFSSSVSSRVSSIETVSASNLTRLSSLEEKTGSLASTGSNTFYGTQTISGTVYIANDLIVQGSSSLQNITASAVSIGTNIVNLNTANPSIRFAGLSIVDSGSVGGSGSFLYDSVQDEMLFIHRGTSTVVTSSVALMGPETYDNVGNETYPTSNRVQKGNGNEHLIDSNISDDGTTIKLLSNTEVTGSLKITGSINTGHGRFKEWYTTGTGLALEAGVSSNIGNVLTFDRTLSRYYPLQLSGGDGEGGNASYIQITTSGVGIGSPTPEEKLDVRGNFLLKGDNTDGGILTITRRYATGPQTINFNNNHPDTNLDWTGARITSADAGNYNGYLDFAVSQGNNGSEAAGTAAVASIMRLTKDGRVGIGTTTPQASLHITAKADTTALTIGAGNGYEIFITGSDSANIYHASPNQAIYLNTNGGKLHLGTSSASTLLTISGSNVGIGIDAPEGILDVYKSNTAGLGGHIILRNNGSAVANETAVLFVDGGIGSVRAAISSTTENSPYFGDIKFKTGATSYGSLNTRMTITGAGNVGIGTTAPNYPLHVYKAGSIATITVGSSTGQNLQFRMEEAGAVRGAITFVPADSSTRFFSNGSDKLTIGSGGNIGIDRVSPLAKLSVYGGAFQLMGDYANHQTIIKNAATAGTLDGSLTITVPDMAGAGSSIGYGGFSCEVYVAGYPGMYCHAWFSGYTNNGITASETTILRSNGGWSVSQFGNGSQGLTFVIDYPSGLIHPTARIIINKGGHSMENEYPANSITAVWT